MLKHKAIVIGTYGGREIWDKECRESLSEYTSHPVVSVNVPWELNVIRWVFEYTSLREFIFLQDTCIVKNYDWLDEVFDHEGSVSLCHKPFYMYLGKYTRYDLLMCKQTHGWPEVRNKREAVTHEGDWTSWYNETATNTKYLWDMPDEQAWAERHGRMNMVYENEHLIKYKGTWKPEMIQEN